MQKIYLTILTLLCMVFLSSCQNTVEGFGKDMQHTGQEIQKSVNN